MPKLYAAQAERKCAGPLAAAHQDAFAPDLATSLVAFGVVLTKERRFVEAMQADREAAAIYGSLAARSPDAFADKLQQAIRNLVIDFRDLGYDDSAIRSELASLLVLQDC